MDYRILYGCISTYDPLISKGQHIIKLLECFTNVVTGHIKAPVSVYVEGPSLRRKRLNLDFRGIKRILAYFSEGQITSLALFIEKDIDLSCHVRVHSNLEEPDSASLIELYIPKKLLKSDIPQELIENYIQVLEYLDTQLLGEGGFITLDVMQTYLAWSAHERQVGISYQTSAKNLKSHFRGYFWGSFLSPSHVMQLGGIEKVVSEAPAFRVKVLENGGVFLQLTENIENVTDEGLKKLKLFLMPILPTLVKEPKPWSYRHMRVIEDEY